MVVIADLVHCLHRLMQMRLRNVRLQILDVVHICALTVEQGKPKDE
jgi:hypothetical protein